RTPARPERKRRMIPPRPRERTAMHAESTSHPAASRASWQRQLRDAVRDVGELAALPELPVDALDPPAGEDAPGSEPPGTAAARRDTGPDRRGVAAAFPLRVPHAFVARMRKRDPRDPLLL